MGGTPESASAQGRLSGTVTHAGTGVPLEGVSVGPVDARARATTDRNGRYSLSLGPGTIRVRFEWLGYSAREVDVTMGTGDRTLDVALEPDPLLLEGITVLAASRQPERVAEAPAAVAIASPEQVRDLAIAHQTPLVVADLPGVHAPRSGVSDFNLNTRGFNASLNRRLLVLVDGRDVAIPIGGNLEWPAVPLEDAARVELVRGPGSALHGANAFNGVLNIVTPSVRQALGTRVTLAGGELSSWSADARHALLSDDLRWGLRLTAGASVSDSWDVSRTELGHLESEYGDAADDAVATPEPGYELRPLEGQTKDTPFGLPGAASGEPDPLRAYHASARVDRYFDDGSVLTAEGGAAYVENQVVTTSTGRSQNLFAARPWARLAWASDRANVLAYYSGRNGESVALGSGVRAKEGSSILHVEGQINRRFADERGRVVLGGSARRIALDSKGSLFKPESDGRSDAYFAAFGQVDFDLTPTVRLVAAARVDDGDLLDTQFSPKLGVVVRPSDDHSFRVTANRAFLTPAALERFLKFPGAAPVDLSLLEAGLRVSPLGPLLAGVPEGALFTNSASVPVFVIGNEALKPQEVRGLEAGWRGTFAGRWTFTADAFYSRTEDFVTGALPGVNPRYGPWTAPDAVPEDYRGAVEGAVLETVGNSLSRLEDGSTAFVVSLGTAGQADEWGLELAGGVQATPRIRFEANYSFYDFELESSAFVEGDSVIPNTPRHRGVLSASFQDGRGLRLRGGVQLVESYDWRNGVWAGRVPGSATVDVSAAIPVHDDLRLTLVGTNLFDQRRYHIYGGSIVGRRLLLGVTWEP